MSLRHPVRQDMQRRRHVIWCVSSRHVFGVSSPCVFRHVMMCVSSDCPGVSSCCVCIYTDIHI